MSLIAESLEAVHDQTLWIQTADIHSKHGIILSCTFSSSESADPGSMRQLGELSERLKQQRYGFVDESALGAEAHEGGLQGAVWHWLRGRVDCCG